MERSGEPLLNVMITAGGTEEAIDDVRKITNTSTGRLAAEIHKALIAYADVKGYPATIHYVAAPGAVMPDLDDRTNVYRISDTHSLQESIQEILTGHKVDVIIHLMAVSDYYVKGVIPTESFAENLITRINEDLSQGKVLTTELLLDHLKTMADRDASAGKISSKDGLMLHLEQTPKIIDKMKALSPDSRLIGFKLLSDVDEKHLIEVAERQRIRCGCDFVVANDMKEIHDGLHKALFVRDGQVFQRCDTKTEIAEALVKEIL